MRRRPLTSLARALLEDPEGLRGVRRVYVMGGAFGGASRGGETAPAEHHIRCDPEAAQVVFGSGT